MRTSCRIQGLQKRYVSECSSARDQSTAGEGPLDQDETTAQSSEAARLAANEFKQLEEDYPKLSVCEQFDRLENFKPSTPIGPEAEFKLKGLADLKALREKSAVVVTQENLVAGREVSNANECKSITDVKPQSSYNKNKIVCLYAWLSSPRDKIKVKLEMKGPDESVLLSKSITIDSNPLSGPSMGYRIWDAKRVRRSGEYELFLYNPSLKKKPLRKQLKAQKGV